MGEARHDLRQPFRYPPKGSELKRRVDNLKAAEESASPFSAYLFEAIGDIVEREFLEAGMPEAPRPAWLEKLLGGYVAGCRREIARGTFLPPLSPRPGNPGPDTVAALVGLRECVQIRAGAKPGTSSNAIFEAVARALGPGINKDHVRRLERLLRQLLPALERQDPKGVGVFIRYLNPPAGEPDALLLGMNPAL